MQVVNADPSGKSGLNVREEVREMRKRNEGGFTLIELMIVIAIIAIIAAIAIPSLLRSRIAANEVAAVGALRSFMAAEEEFRMADIVDQDSDGAGEYGYFQELCATIAPPGHAVPVSPGFFDPVFGVVNAQGAASKTGYYYRIFLPGPDGGPAVAEATGVNSTTASPGAMNSRENRWTAYAWPMDYDSTGRRAFVVNQAGNVFATAAMVLTYDATATMPAANAAYVVGTVNLSGALANGVADDGNTWHPSD